MYPRTTRVHARASRSAALNRAVWSIIVCLCGLSFGHADESVSFNRDIRPLFSENCLACHGNDAAKREARLRLDDPASVFDDTRRGGPVLVPGDPDASELIRRITSDDPDDRMPPPESGKSLTATQIAIVQHWVEDGAAYEEHWSFIPPVRVLPGNVANGEWTTNAIDAFIVARLEQEGIAPAPEASRRTLIRRVYLDLIGLPPSPEAVAAFIRDETPGAYERVVDTVLDSPHFGERWGRHWLDAARYADSSGYSEDSPRSIWPYRDWVIDALNNDMPFDRFVVEQLAGDLMPNATLSQKIATGFHRNTMTNEEGGIDPEEFRVHAVIDRVNTTGAVLLGLTVGCAQCHDHKYDPVSQEEFYGLFAYFNNDNEIELTVSSDEAIAARELMEAGVARIEGRLQAYVEGNLPAWEANLTPDRVATFSESVQEALSVAPDRRDLRNKLLVADRFIRDDDQAANLRANMDSLREDAPEIHTTLVLENLDGGRETHLLNMGDYTQPAHVIAAKVPAVLHDLTAPSSGSRLDLARWIVDPANPLTARVTVNRMWQHLFGRGLVETENDFGTQGAQPSHPELLDWLATEFVESGWDMKAIIRLLVTSSTYRASSNARPELLDADPVNRLWARQDRLRLDAEIIRDTGLAVSGLLNRTVGGPGVHPPQPEGVMNYGRLKHDWETDEDWRRYRRGMYTYFWRGTPHPALIVFDAPTAITTCTRRQRSTTPLQALTLLNDEQFHEMAQALARRLASADGTDAERIAQAFNLCLGRNPTPEETRIATQLLGDTSDSNRWIPIARVLLNLDEFINRE